MKARSKPRGRHIKIFKQLFILHAINYRATVQKYKVHTRSIASPNASIVSEIKQAINEALASCPGIEEDESIESAIPAIEAELRAEEAFVSIQVPVSD